MAPTWPAPSERLAHVEELLPEICTLDCGTMNFAAGGDYIMANTPGMLRAMAREVQQLGVRPELEVFDTGHLVLVNELIDEGLIDDPPLIQLCMGIPYGAPDDLGDAARDGGAAAAGDGVLDVRDRPHAARLSRRSRRSSVANVRVGLEDNLYLERGTAGDERGARGASGRHLSRG